MVANLMRQPLLVSGLLVHAERHHGARAIVSRLGDGTVHRCTYADLAARARRLANALAVLGVRREDRVASLAWNGHRHLELVHAVAGSGAVLHTLAPESGADQVTWMLRHASDGVLFFDLGFLPLVESVVAQGVPVRHLVAMTDRAHLPAARGGPPLLCYEDLLAAHADRFTWPQLDEDTVASLCYVHGDDGVPRGVVHTHRSTMLQAYAATQPDAFDCGVADVVLPAVPMAHGSAWGLPHVACMVGAKLVFAGPWLGGPSLCQLLDDESVTIAAALPGTWQRVLRHVGDRGLDLGRLRQVIVGGMAGMVSAEAVGPASRQGGRLLHAWSPTRTRVAGTVCVLAPGQLVLGADRRLAVPTQHGHAVFGIEMKIVGEAGDELPRDGVARGDLLVRAPWVAAGSFRGSGTPGVGWPDGWCPTGETAAIDSHGAVHLFASAPADRAPPP